MLFNSIEFAIFLPIVFTIYWLFNNRNLKLQNSLLVLASYFFYGWWDWRFLSLIILSSCVDYIIGIRLAKTNENRKRKILLMTSILVNLGLLGFFKYFNFFAQSFADAFTLLGKPIEASRLNIILPVGISFYTFQTLSYSIDVYKGKFKPTKDIISFFAFVSFFPQLVAGPIERATNLLPQFYKKRSFEYDKAIDGMRQILWGLFKKIVIADNCAIYVNDVFSNYSSYKGSTLLIGSILFAFQIYGDFSGYSDIAIGTSRLFGFNLKRNFAYPYFSRDMAEFWRRWHISLNTWFRDYLYIPLGGSRGGNWMKIRNTFAIFLVSGLWHGANWTFLAWGFLNACYFLPLLLTKNNRINIGVVAHDRILPSVKEVLQIGLTFGLTVFAWIFFRSDNLSNAFAFIKGLFSSLFTSPVKDIGSIYPGKHIWYLFFFLIIFIFIEWINRNREYALEISGIRIPKMLRWGLYYALIISCFAMNGVQQDFIYFQF
ncbi:MAG: MBOAT family protein [Bacteroidales bacterium]|nr:MBOAT family protein [Bacteroidales bacterium]